MTESMDKQAAAERDRRKKVLEAEGDTSFNRTFSRYSLVEHPIIEHSP